MTLKHLGSEDRELIRRCLATLINGEDLQGEFQTRLGVTESQVAELLMRWPDVDDRADDSVAALAINNALNELLHGLGLSDIELQGRVGASHDRIANLYREWARLRGQRSTGVR